MSTTFYTSANLGASGLVGTAGLAVYTAGASTLFAARTRVGIVETLAGSGIYTSSFEADGATSYVVLWDDGGSPPVYALDSVSPSPDADSILLRDWTEVVGDVPDRCMLQALRFLRNKWDTSTGTLIVKAEDDTTTAWSKPLATDAAALPVTGTGAG